MKSAVKSGVYIVQYDSNTIKIGRSKNIESRLKSYKGYMRDGQDVKQLLIVYTLQHKVVESWSHLFAQSRNLQRIGKCEIFKIDNIEQFLEDFQRQVVSSFGSEVSIQIPVQKPVEQTTQQISSLRITEQQPDLDKMMDSLSKKSSVSVSKMDAYLDQFRYRPRPDTQQDIKNLIHNFQKLKL